MNREAWLEKMMALSRAHFKRAGYDLPEKIRVSCGWPSKGGLGKAKRVIGQCWSHRCSTDGSYEIMVSPTLDNPVKVVGVLIHELAHAAVGTECGHKAPFKRCATAVGLEGKMTATTETDELIEKINGWVKRVGDYPHKRIDASNAPKQSTRLLLMECGCGLKIRTTAKWVDEYGDEWACPCGGSLILQV